MPRPTWRGSISFGLVNVPIKLYTAARSKDVRFNMLHEKDGSRIQLRRFCADEGVEVQTDEIVKGYELGADRYVVVTADELDALEPTVTSGIEIEEFVDLDQIDPVYFENSYYLTPDKGGAKAYGLLLAAMRQANKVALGRVVLRQKQYLVALRPAGKTIAMQTLYYPDEVVAVDSLDELPEDEMAVSDREVAMAQQLIATLAADFDPDKYTDEYREAVLALIDRKAAGEEVVMPAAKGEEPKVVDIMAALEASIAAARGDKQAKRSA